jgi:hypothetical protein
METKLVEYLLRKNYMEILPMEFIYRDRLTGRKKQDYAMLTPFELMWNGGISKANFKRIEIYPQATRHFENILRSTCNDKDYVQEILDLIDDDKAWFAYFEDKYGNRVNILLLDRGEEEQV